MPASNQGASRPAWTGLACVPAGFRTFVRDPAFWVLGLLPAVVALFLVAALAVVLAFWIDDVVAWVTPFADAWSSGWRTAVRVSVGIAIFGAYVFLVVVSFAAVTNVIGQPFFEKMSDHLEGKLGNVPPELDTPWWRTLPRATAGSIAVFAMYAILAVPLLLLGFVPVVGQTVVPVLAAIVSGWFLSLELLSIPLDRRGYRLGDRLRFHWRHRVPVTAFGIAFFLLFLVPLMNVVAMPAAILGGTLLVRRLLGVADTAGGKPAAP